MAIDLHIHVARGQDHRLSGTVRAVDGQLHSFSGTLELLRVFEDLLAADPASRHEEGLDER
ncbi:MAG TPA: hypothetical protein VMF14_00895 [Solirubrobacteraceae bacterium]|nr:hypothetical protein [Solirubrobacteraceae bacterium]